MEKREKDGEQHLDEEELRRREKLRQTETKVSIVAIIDFYLGNIPNLSAYIYCFFENMFVQSAFHNNKRALSGNVKQPSSSQALSLK